LGPGERSYDPGTDAAQRALSGRWVWRRNSRPQARLTDPGGVVSGARAQYKGVGTVNGTSGFGFMLTAIDGQLDGGGSTDKFRIKIWNIATSEMIYDNQMRASDSATPSTAIGGGSIIIHK
jgi:hypothetical protein